MEAKTGAIDGRERRHWRLKMEPWRVCRPVVADLHHLDEEQDLDPHFSEKPDPELQPHPTPVVDSGSGSSFK